MQHNKSSTLEDPRKILKDIRLENVNRLIFAQLSTNSIPNKFFFFLIDSFVNIIDNNIGDFQNKG